MKRLFMMVRRFLDVLHSIELNGRTTTVNSSLDQHIYTTWYLPSSFVWLIQTNGDPTWQARLNALLTAAQSRFFEAGVLWEPACETNLNCDKDQFCLKGFL